MWRGLLREKTSEVYVAEEAQDIIAWICVSKSRDPDAKPTTGELWAIYVEPGHWGRGVGRALWDRGGSYLKASGFSDVTLWTFKDNRRALRFYESAGFTLEPGHQKTIELGGADIVEVRLRRHLGD